MRREKIIDKNRRRRRALIKRYKSIENKLCKEDRIWWDSLSIKARYSVLFQWLSEKSIGVKFKHFKKKVKQTHIPSIQNVRNTIIKNLTS